MVSGPRRIGRRGRPLLAVVGGEEPELCRLSSGYQRSPGSVRRLSCGPHAFVNVTRPPPAVRPSDHPSSILHDRFIKGQNAGITQITPLGAMPPTRRHPRFRAAATSTTLQPFRRPISVSGRGSSGGGGAFFAVGGLSCWRGRKPKDLLYLNSSEGRGTVSDPSVSDPRQRRRLASELI